MSPSDEKRIGIEAYVKILEALATVNGALINTSTPKMYESGVVYGSSRPPGDDTLRGVRQILKGKTADIDELCAWRCAELRAAGEQASISIAYDNNHIMCRVRRADGSLEDPSKQMKENMTKDQEDLKTAIAESAELINEARESFERLVGSGFYPGGRINQEEFDEYTQTLETASRTNLRKMGDLHRSIMKCIRRARKVSKTKKW